MNPPMNSSCDRGANRPWRWAAALAAIFALVHALYYVLGVRFDRSTLIEVMHYLDPELLRTRLAESLWHLHIQPPLLNLLTGLILKLTPSSAWLFQAVFLLFGFSLYASLFVLQVRLRVHRMLALALSTVFMASPPFILWEHYLLYMMPCAALLALAAVLLFEIAAHGRAWAVAAFFTAIFLLCATWSMFHLSYLVLVWLALAVAMREKRRRVMLIGLIPVLLLTAVYAKNWALFGEFNVCSFSGKNLWIMTVGNLNRDDRARLVKEGKLSPLSLINRWAHLGAYPPEYAAVPERFREIPALARPYKSTGAVNYNHYGNIAICRVYAKDARYGLFHRPQAFLTSVVFATFRYFVPSSDLPVSPGNQQQIRGIIAFYDALHGKVPFSLGPLESFWERVGHRPFLFFLLGLPVLFLFGLQAAVRRPQGMDALDFPRRAVLAFFCFHIAMVAALGCSLDFLDAARYRFVTDAFYIALLGLLLSRLAAGIRAFLAHDV